MLRIPKRRKIVHLQILLPNRPVKALRRYVLVANIRWLGDNVLRGG